VAFLSQSKTQRGNRLESRARGRVSLRNLSKRHNADCLLDLHIGSVAVKRKVVIVPPKSSWHEQNREAALVGGVVDVV